MTFHDLGYRREGKSRRLVHDSERTELEQLCLDSIETWCQRGKPIGADHLAGWLGLRDRELRHLTLHLASRETHGEPVHGLPGCNGGYFIPKHPALKDLVGPAVAAQLARAKTSALKARDLGATAQELSQSVVQLTLDLGPEVREQVSLSLPAPHRTRATDAQVRAALRRYAADPQRFADQIAELRNVFGGVFVTEDELARALRVQTEEAVQRTLAQLKGRAA